MAAVVHADRLLPFRAIAGKVVAIEQPATALHVRDEALGDFSGIERVTPAIGQ